MTTFALVLGGLIAPGLRADAELDRKIESAAQGSHVFRTAVTGHVGVRSENGVVTLTGRVADREQRALAEETVRGLPGVVTVDNQLAVAEREAARGDGWIALQIRGVLLVRRSVSARHTDVSVRDGVVTLTGIAHSEQQRWLTESCAREVQGVKSVINQLRVVSAGAELKAPAATE